MNTIRTFITRLATRLQRMHWQRERDRQIATLRRHAQHQLNTRPRVTR
ncbi:MAG: hypothetical protein AB7P37_03380 [Ramlibacter sp.]